MRYIRPGKVTCAGIVVIFMVLPNSIWKGADAQIAPVRKSKIELTKGGEPTMSAWRRNLFIATSRLSTDGAESFCLPQDRTLIEGSRIEV